MTKGDRDGEDEEEGGGGRGRTERSCMDRVSIRETELPEAKARRPEEVTSAAPPLLRPGGPGSIDSHGFGSEDGGEIVAIFIFVYK